MIIGKILRGQENEADREKTRKRRSRTAPEEQAAHGRMHCPVCVTRGQNTQKLRELEFTVLDKYAVPEEFKLLIDENKTEPFKLTYADQGQLYIAEGYGEQPTTGYSVEVTDLYETEDAVCIHTNLLGPEKGEETNYDLILKDFIADRLARIEERGTFSPDPRRP